VFGLFKEEIMPAETFYEAVRRSGVSRRDFLRFCATTAAFLGLEGSALPQVVKALETQKRPPIYWLNFAACSCCSESLIKSSHPLASEALLGVISMDYMETIQAAAGQQAEEVARNGMKENFGNYILAVEGSVPTADGGIYCTIGGRTALESLNEAARGAKAILCVGSCSSFGCVTVAKPNPTGCQPIHKLVTDKPVINIPGCPPIPEVIMGTIVHLVTFGSLPVLDRLQRPRVFYGQRIHDKCYRRAFFDAGMFVENFDDEGARKGWCLYKVGCRGPVTYNACSVTKWNDATSFPIQSGHPCLGCSEPDYWDRNPLYQHVANVPLPGLATADTIGGIFAGSVAAATVAHMVASTIKKATHKGAKDAPEENSASGKEE
jgi:hydrogenase small subunit